MSWDPDQMCRQWRMSYVSQMQSKTELIGILEHLDFDVIFETADDRVVLPMDSPAYFAGGGAKSPANGVVAGTAGVQNGVTASDAVNYGYLNLTCAYNTTEKINNEISANNTAAKAALLAMLNAGGMGFLAPDDPAIEAFIEQELVGKQERNLVNSTENKNVLLCLYGPTLLNATLNIGLLWARLGGGPKYPWAEVPSAYTEKYELKVPQSEVEYYYRRKRGYPWSFLSSLATSSVVATSNSNSGGGK